MSDLLSCIRVRGTQTIECEVSQAKCSTQLLYWEMNQVSLCTMISSQ